MKTNYPDSDAIKTWTKDAIEFFVVARPRLGHYCGYCRFPRRPLIEQGYHGIATYAPVHGGITYAEEDKDGSIVYGFDCAHSGDDEDPQTRDLVWLMAECERMAVAITLACDYEKDYLCARDNKQKAAVLDNYHRACKDKGIRFELRDNLGAMINVLLGREL